MKKLGKYVRKKMTKLMVSNKRKRKSEKNEWNWEERKIEQVNEFKYLCSGMCLGNKREKVWRRYHEENDDV
jgi:hypothetical protein